MLPKAARFILQKAIASVNSYHLVKSCLVFENNNLTFTEHSNKDSYYVNNNVKIIAAGKAVGGMTHAIQDILRDNILSGVVSIPKGYQNLFTDRLELTPILNNKIEIYEGADGNLPDDNSLLASKAIYRLAETARVGDLYIVLLSGGGSSLMSYPSGNITIDEKRNVCKLLTSCGASIKELNVLRKHLSKLKGGNLYRLLASAQVLVMVLTDIVGDHLDIVASGPCYPSSSTSEDCLNIIDKYNLWSKLPGSVQQELTSRKTDVMSLKCPTHILIGSNRIALHECRMICKDLLYSSIVWSDSIQNDIIELSGHFAALILTKAIFEFTCGQIQIKEIFNNCIENLALNLSEQLFKSMCEALELKSDNGQFSFISGGEPTVVVRGNGVGGRNQELVLMVAINLYTLKENLSIILRNSAILCAKFREFWDKSLILFASLGTDGQDGPTPAAGAAIAQHFVCENLKYLDLIHSSLSNNDSYNLFSKLGHEKYLLVPGLTGTNVMDIQLVLLSFPNIN